MKKNLQIVAVALAAVAVMFFSQCKKDGLTQPTTTINKSTTKIEAASAKKDTICCGVTSNTLAPAKTAAKDTICCGVKAISAKKDTICCGINSKTVAPSTTTTTTKKDTICCGVN